MPAELPVPFLQRLCTALGGSDPESALSDALGVLSSGLGLHSLPDASEPWLRVTHEGRSLSLVVSLAPGVVAPDAEMRTFVATLLHAGLVRAASHEEHRRVRERMDMLSAASFEGIFIHVDGVVIDANQRVAEMLGREPAEVLGDRTLHECVAPEDLPGVLRRMGERMEGGYLITGVRKDGSRFRAELHSKQGKLGDRPVRVVAVRDVTEREHTSELLRESEARLRDLMAVAFDVFVLSRDGVIIDVGGRVEDVFGYRREDLVGRPALGLVAPSALPLATRMLTEGRIGAYESVVVSASGESVPVEVVAVASTLDGKPVRVGALRDLRQVRRLEAESRKLHEQLVRSQRLDSLGVLAGGIAHDFNNLLVGVICNAELLLARVKDPFDQESARAILSAGERAAGLTAQMLAYAGHRDLGRREPVDLAALLVELRTLLDATLSKKAQIEIVVQPGSVVLGGRATLTQVFMNLLANASDALEGKPGRIDVRAKRVQRPDARWDHALGAHVRPGEWIEVQVTDTGIGMEEAMLGRVFEPFFSTKASGHGLGLAACLGIVAAHGGAIVVDSVVGRGTTFSVLLPAAESPSATAHGELVPGVPVAPRRILVIDDEDLVRSQLRRVLERRGHTVDEASDGQSGLRFLESTTVDLIVLDMTMPDLDGAEVLKRLRAAGCEIPVVLSSGYLDAAAERGLDRATFQGFLLKPYGVSELVEALERALGAD